MSNDSEDRASAHARRVDFTIRANAENVSISRPVSREDVERVRHQLAEWAARRPS